MTTGMRDSKFKRDEGDGKCDDLNQPPEASLLDQLPVPVCINCQQSWRGRQLACQPMLLKRTRLKNKSLKSVNKALTRYLKELSEEAAALAREWTR